MRIGIPVEVKDQEHRVSVTPAGVRELTRAGHDVVIQRGAGSGAGFVDADYLDAGGLLADDAAGAFDTDLVVKVKEPIAGEFGLLRPGQVLFTYLHLAGNRSLTQALLEQRVTGVAYETVRDATGRLPLLAPMSEVAGRMAPQVAAASLERVRAGRGILLGGATGVAPARVVVIGAGVAGSHAARIAAGMEAEVIALDTNVDRLAAVAADSGRRVRTMVSSREAIVSLLAEADVVVGAVLIPGARAPWVLLSEDIDVMRPGAVVVDLSIDQGGCFETSQMTTHTTPTFVDRGVVHYCVGNIPGAVPRTSTMALASVTLPFVLRLADEGLDALVGDPVLRQGLNTFDGAVTNAAVAEAHGLEATPIDSVLRPAA